MKHLLIAASLSGALLADAIILEEYTIENATWILRINNN